MSIQLLCVSHKTADTKIRGLFAFDDDAKARIIMFPLTRFQIKRSVC